jgi:hypothetical protein
VAIERSIVDPAIGGTTTRRDDLKHGTNAA